MKFKVEKILSYLIILNLIVTTIINPVTEEFKWVIVGLIISGALFVVLFIYAIIYDCWYKKDLKEAKKRFLEETKGD